MSPPWSLRVEDEAPLTVVAVVRGWAWLQADGAPCRIGCGDVAILRGPAPYTVADTPGRPAQAVILPGQHCSAVPGAGPPLMGPLGIRTWGNDPAGGTEMLTGTYQVTREVSQRLLRALPPLLVLWAGEWDCPLIRWPSWPAGASRSRPTCSANLRPRSVPSPARSDTPAPTR